MKTISLFYLNRPYSIGGKVSPLFVYLLAFFILFPALLKAQDLSIGVKGGLYQHYSFATIDPTWVGNWRVTTWNDGVGPGHTVSVFSRLQWNLFYLQAELRHAGDAVKFLAVNWERGNEAWGKVTSGQDMIEDGFYYHRLDLPFVVGLKVFKRFRMYGGVVSSFYLPPARARAKVFDEHYDLDALPKAMHESFEPYFFNASLGSGVDIGRFVIDVNWERSITPIAEDVHYFGESYSFPSHTIRLMVTVGFKVFRAKDIFSGGRLSIK